MRVLLLDADLDVDASSATFSSNHSLYEYDVVFWAPLRSLSLHYFQSGWGASSYRGLRQLSDDASARVKRDCRRRADELEEFLRLGRTLVVFLPSDLSVWVDSGRRETSGTGRNAKVTTIVEPFDILDTLPFGLSRQYVTGYRMEPVHSSIGPLYRQTEDFWSYASTITSSETLLPLLRVAGTDKIVAAQVLSEDGGRIILLPFLHTGSDDDEDDEDEDFEPDEEEADDIGDLDDEDDRDESVVAEEEGNSSVPAGEDTTETEEGDQDALSPEAVDAMVLDWVLALIGEQEIEWPEWIDDYRFQSEVERIPQIADREAQIDALQTQLDDLTRDQEADKQWKLLVAGTGTPFEDAVAAALTELGFALEPTMPGRTDLRGMRGSRPVVVETKGVSKSAAESHCAQLEKWVAEELEGGRKAKGILVINAWLKLAPVMRTDAAFPPQMRPYAEMREHCLVTGAQLLNLARAVMSEPARRDEVASILLDTSGVIEGWDDLSEVFSEMPASPTKPSRRTRTKTT